MIQLIAEAAPTPGFVFNAWQALLGALGGAASVAIIMSSMRKREKVRVVPPIPPIEVEGELKTIPKGRRFNAGEWDAKHVDVTRRLDTHEEEIKTIWGTMRKEDEATRAELNQTFQSIQRSLGRIEGKLEGKH